MMKTYLRFYLTPLVLACVGSFAHAQSTQPQAAQKGAYIQYGDAPGASSYTVGVTSPMQWRGNLWGMQTTGYWDVYASKIRSSSLDGGNNSTWLLGLTPTLRLRFDEGNSPWFLDGGIGLSYSDVHYSNRDKDFSTRFNFGDHVAVGYNFGPRREHELSLRVQHYSNGGFKKPNPGENYVQLRYLHSF